MKKKLIAVILVAIMMTLTFMYLQPAKAGQHDITGFDNGYNTAISTGQQPVYCECNHDKNEGDSDDSEAGLGVYAQYCLVGYPQNPMFNYVIWTFEGEAGRDRSVRMVDSLLIDPCVNGNGDMYYNYYGTEYYGKPPGFPNANYDIYYHFYNLSSSISPVYSVEGRSIQAFYEAGNPWNSWSIEAKTQNPFNDPDGYGWTYISNTWDQV